MSEEYDFIEHVDGQPFLEVSDSDEYVALDAVFERYSRDFDIVDTARFFSMTPEDVRNGITYWRDNPEAFDQLQSDSDQPKYIEESELEEASTQSQSTPDASQTVDPLGTATNIFLGLMTDHRLENPRLNNSPRENYFVEASDEVHLEWELEGHDLSVYAGVDRQEGQGFVSFSVDQNNGETVVINEDDQRIVNASEGDFEDRLTQMYNNAVLATRNLG